MEEAEEETHPPTDLQIQPDAVSQLDRVTCDLCEELEHKRSRLLDLIDNVKGLRSYLEKDRVCF